MIRSVETAALLPAASEIVYKAGVLLSDRDLATQIRKKGTTDFVTSVDLAVQKRIQEQLRQLDSTIQFMGEEQDNVLPDGKKPTWILDPVDGTTNLIHGFRHSGISLALAEGGEVLLGIIYDPYADELFTAEKKHGAFCNGRPVHVSNVAALSDSLCSVGTNPGIRDQSEAAFRRMWSVYDRCHDVRRIGAASIEICYVACGRLDAYLEHGLKPWDFAAGKLILEEAGGRITDFNGENPFLYGDRCDILATNSQIHHELQSIL